MNIEITVKLVDGDNSKFLHEDLKPVPDKMDPARAVRYMLNEAQEKFWAIEHKLPPYNVSPT